MFWGRQLSTDSSVESGKNVQVESLHNMSIFPHDYLLPADSAVFASKLPAAVLRSIENRGQLAVKPLFHLSQNPSPKLAAGLSILCLDESSRSELSSWVLR